MAGPYSVPAVSEPEPHPEPSQASAGRRQFVSFTIWKLDPAFRRQDTATKQAAKQEFAAAVERRPQEFIGLAYSCVGLKADADFLLWRIAYDVDAIQEHTAGLNRTVLAGWLTQTHSFLSMTKRSQYLDPVDPFHDAESRTRLVPGRRKFLFVYPFVKTRQWYLLRLEKRQEIMTEHIRRGNKYPSVKLNTTYSFGLDDQDFVVAFETDEPKDFLDLVQDLRETQSSLYTQRDTPIFTCVQKPIAEILDGLFS